MESFIRIILNLKKIDETRLAANESLKPILRKIFDSLRSDTARDRALAGEGVDFFGTKSSLQLAHKFKLSGVTEGFAADKLREKELKLKSYT